MPTCQVLEIDVLPSNKGTVSQSKQLIFLTFMNLWVLHLARSQELNFPLTKDFNAVGNSTILIPIANDSGVNGDFGNVTIPMTSCITTATTGAYAFPNNAGLHFPNNGFITGAYSLEMTFKVDELNIRSGRSVDWINLVSFNQTLSDQGIYIRIGSAGTGRLQFWDSNSSQRNITGDLFNETDVFHLVLTRSTSGLFTIYLNGTAAEINYDDTLENYLPNTVDDAIYLFRDFPLADIDAITQKLDDEASPGWVKGLNITNTTWTEQEVNNRWESVCERLIDVEFTTVNTCLNDETLFEIQTNVADADSILWNFDDSGSASNSGSGTTTSHIFSSNGDFNVIATIYYEDTPTPFSQMVNISALPLVDLGPDQTLDEGQHLTLDAGNAGANFVWQDLSDQQTFEVSTSGTYSVAVTNLNGCTASDSVEIRFRTLDRFPVEVPNVFTPNGDGNHDLWVIKNLELYPDHELKLFDRQGNLIKDWRPYDNSWDGETNGSTSSIGTYFYILTDNNQVLKKGSVSIIK